jgi:hypothetical protein
MAVSYTKNNMIARITAFVKSYWYDLFVLGCVVCIAVISYNLGHTNALQKTPITVIEGANIFTAGSISESSSDPLIIQAAAAPRDPRVVVSKASSSKKYHFTWCSGAKRITQTNQLWFENESAAQKAGYTLAGNCQ